ncbi:MAG: DUF1351 domain-containing protein [Bacilli bacterium]|nr:DUF1351 domain-containing protein [Bacilli bacterium]
MEENNSVATSLQLVISPLQKMEAIKFNYEELKEGLKNSLTKYKNIVYTPETIKEAKDDRARLNSLAKSLNDGKINIKKEFMVPYDEFEGKIKELIELVKEPANEIDNQIKAFEEKEKAEKRNEIEKIYQENIGEYENLILLEKIYDSRWENKTYKLTDIKKEIQDVVKKADSDLKVINSQQTEFLLNIKDVYFNTLDLGQALVEKERLEKQKELLKPKEEIVEAVVEEPAHNDDAVDAMRYAVDTAIEESKQVEEKMVKITFTVECTESQLLALGQYMKANGIKYGRAE